MRPIHVWRWRALTVWIVAFTVATGLGIRENRHLAREGVTAHQALCAFKLDLRFRVATAEDYLRQHPAGFPGISRATISNSIANQQRTLASLNKLRCQQKGATS